MAKYELSVRDQRLFRDVSWLMAKVDPYFIIERLKIPVESKTGPIIRSYCPDHYLFTKRKSSHPNWFFNMATGDTFCHTEGRGSNIVYVISRLRDISPKDAANWILGEEELDLHQLGAAFDGITKLFDNDQEEDGVIKGLHDMQTDVDKRIMFANGYDFFIQPPEGKMATNIIKETVDHFMVCQRTWGFWKDRVVLPVYYKKEMTGFVAVDMLGKKKWLRYHPTEGEKEYRKTRYPKGFKSGRNLYGYDNVEKGSDRLILTEGPRETMKLWQEGFTNTVSIFGINVTSGHMRLLSELNPLNIFIMFDGDEAGRRATKKIANKLKHMYSIYTVDTPIGCDPKNMNRMEIKNSLRNSIRFE